MSPIARPRAYLIFTGSGPILALFAEGSYWELVDAGVFFAFAGVRPGASIDEVESRFFGEIARDR